MWVHFHRPNAKSEPVFKSQNLGGGRKVTGATLLGVDALDFIWVFALSAAAVGSRCLLVTVARGTDKFIERAPSGLVSQIQAGAGPHVLVWALSWLRWVPTRECFWVSCIIHSRLRCRRSVCACVSWVRSCGLNRVGPGPGPGRGLRCRSNSGRGESPRLSYLGTAPYR